MTRYILLPGPDDKRSYCWYIFWISFNEDSHPDDHFEDYLQRVKKIWGYHLSERLKEGCEINEIFLLEFPTSSTIPDRYFLIKNEKRNRRIIYKVGEIVDRLAKDGAVDTKVGWINRSQEIRTTEREEGTNPSIEAIKTLLLQSYLPKKMS